MKLNKHQLMLLSTKNRTSYFEHIDGWTISPCIVSDIFFLVKINRYGDKIEVMSSLVESRYI